MTKKHKDPKPAIHKLARIKDKATSTYVEVIKFRVSECEHGTLELPPSIVNDMHLLEKRLRDAGAILPKDDSKLEELLVAVAKSDPPEERVYEAHTGFRGRESVRYCRRNFR
jgi:hypothetical protein